MRTRLVASVLLWGLGLVSGCCCVDRTYYPGACGGGLAHAVGSATRERLTCGSGCGDVYWGEWTSDPPDACDPCDGGGNWLGTPCCYPRWWNRLVCPRPGFWTDGGCGHGAGCTSCGTEEEFTWEGETYYEGEMIQSPETVRKSPGVPKEAHPQTAPGKAPDNEQVQPPKPIPDKQATRMRVPSRGPRPPSFPSVRQGASPNRAFREASGPAVIRR